MKKLFFSFFVLAACLTSCSNDDDKNDDNTGNTTEMLVKKWYYESTIYNGVTEPYDDHEECGRDYLEFLENGVLREVDVWDCEIYSDEGTWELIGEEQLRLSMYGDYINAKVLLLNENELRLEIAFEEDEDDREIIIFSAD